MSLLRQYVELLSRLQSAANAPQEQTNSISPCQGAGPRRNANLSVETNGDGQRRGKGDASEKKKKRRRGGGRDGRRQTVPRQRGWKYPESDAASEKCTKLHRE